MSTLRRTKSLNDKVKRQKHRSCDVVRDPRTPDVAGERTRTRTCLDNYQLLIHLRKQADDKSRQLELAYAMGGNTRFLRSQGAPRGPEPRPWSELSPSSPTAGASATQRHGCHTASSGSARPSAVSVPRSSGGCSGQDPGQGGPPEGQHDRDSQQQGQKGQRPISMFEPRGRGLSPTMEERRRKDQIIQNLTESQRFVNTHNQQLLHKNSELESENVRLREILHAHGISAVTLPRARKLASYKGTPLSQGAAHVHGTPRSEPFPELSSSLISPISETSVSDYGSLAPSASGESCTVTLKAGGGGGGRTEEMGDYNDDTLPLSEVSLERVGSEASTLPTSLSSGGDSRVHTMNRGSEKGDLESLREKVDEILELERYRGDDGKKRMTEMELQVAELTEQRNALLERYKHIVDENEKLQNREEHFREELHGLLQQHGQTLQHVIRSELQHLHEELQGLGQDLRGQLEVVLTALASPDPDRGRVVDMDPEVKNVVDRIVDLVGPEYLRLGRQLHVPPLELEGIERGREDFGQKTMKVLHSWLRHRQQQQQQQESFSIQALPAQVLTQALRDIDKDIRLFNHTPISTPERNALRNSLQRAIDHVTDPSHVLDQLISLSELTPSGISFVQEVLEESRERALCRLWHVSEYRGNGIISRLALALERSGHPHVSRILTDELEIQNARFYSHHYHPLYEGASTPVASQAAQSLGSRPSPSSSHGATPTRSKSGSSTPRSERGFEAVGLPVRSPSLPEEKEIVWDRRVSRGTPGGGAYSPRRGAVQQGTRISLV